MDRPRRLSKGFEIKTREQVINYFYKCMLDYIVDQWEDEINTTSYVPISSKMIIVPNRTYIQMCNDDELESNELPHQESESVFNKSTSRIRATRPRRNRRTRQRKFSSYMKVTESQLFEEPQIFDEPPPPDFEDCVNITFKNGNSYSGPCLKKRFHGNGKFRWSDGSSYIGEFKNGSIIGKGKFYYNDQSFYDGEVYQGYPHGLGKKYAPESPSAYSGEWNMGKKHGTGWVIFSEDNWYEGTWYLDKMHGKGVRCYPSGSKYQGDFYKSKRHGYGCAILWNNDIYVGEWTNGKRSGFGQYIWQGFFNHNFCIPVQNKYIGQWSRDRMHGKGEMNFGSVNGARYIGQFYKNDKHGAGLVFCDNGDVIECDRIFANDKPVRFYENGKKVEKIMHLDETCVEHCRRVYKRIESCTDPNEKIQVQTINKRPLYINKTVFLVPPSDTGVLSMEDSDLCQFKLTRNSPKKFSLQLAIHSCGESINLDPYIRNFCSIIDYNEPALGTTDSVIIKPNSWQDVGVPSTDKPPVKYNYHEIYEIEEKALKRAIQINLRRLRQIYKQYSLIGCMKNMPFETIMNRLFLWQMFRDCKISEKGVSISQIDVLLAEGSFSLDETIHDPFENIYFWQFLTSLVRTSWEIYGNKTIKYVYEGRSILEEIFTKFLNQDIFPHVGHHTGTVLFDYKDLIPIKAAYNWFKSIEEPMSIKTLIMNIFSKNKNEIYKYEPHSNNFFIKNGTNISMGNNIIFLEDEEPKFCVGPGREKIPPLQRKCLRRKLYFLHDLNLKLLYKKIQSVVPGIFTNKECFNHDYKLCFLEFYEIILTCTQHILKKKELTFKKKYVTKISENSENVVLKTVQTKKSKQYRKSASHHSMKRPVS